MTENLITLDLRCAFERPQFAGPCSRNTSPTDPNKNRDTLPCAEGEGDVQNGGIRLSGEGRRRTWISQNTFVAFFLS